jgi:DNA-binding FrmR family transcriptional regulator
MKVRAPGPRGAAVRHAQRASGQVTALAGMIDAGRPFPEIAQQVLASRGSLDSLLVRLASRPGLIRVVNRWHLEHASGTKLVLAVVVLALGFAILLTV